MSFSVDIARLLTQVDALIDTMYVVRDHFGLSPTKEHVATCINYADLQELREEFVSELVGTMIPFMYSKAKRDELISRFSPKRSADAAQEKLRQHCLKKFRQSSSQGQFAELLLCNLLQHYFKAAPLVRKMPITTNPSVERNGADAIHIAVVDGKPRIYVGEAKAYAAKGDSLRAAVIDAARDVVEKHYPRLRSELDLYVYEPFVPAELEQVARDFREGNLPDAEVHLVCIIAYDFREELRGGRENRLLTLMHDVSVGMTDLHASKPFQSFDQQLIPRLNYIVFPVPRLLDLIGDFRRVLGIPT